MGTTGTADATLDGTDVNLCASTAFTLASGEGPLHGDPVTIAAPFDGTSSPIKAYLSVLVDNAKIAGSTTIALQGTVTIHWVELGDY